MKTNTEQTKKEVKKLSESIFKKWRPFLMYDCYDKTNWTIDRGVRYHIDTDGTMSILSVGKASHKRAYEPVTIKDLQYILQWGESREYTKYLKRNNEVTVAERKANRKKSAGSIQS